MTDIVKINDNYVKKLMTLLKTDKFINNKLMLNQFDEEYNTQMTNINNTIIYFTNYDFYNILYILNEYLKFINFQLFYYLKLVQFDKYIVPKEKDL